MLGKLKFCGEPVLVTGGAAGIGRATAKALIEMGATVAIVGRTSKSLEAAAAELTSEGGSCEIFAADVSREGDVAALASWIGTKWGRLKGLVNNAGTNFRAPIEQLETDKWREICAANLDSIFFMCRAFIPLLLKADSPAIVNVASSFGVIGNPQMPAYCATKGAVVNLTRQLALDYGRSGLRANSLCPGPTLSPRLRSYIDKGLTEIQLLERQVPLGRLAQCDEIGGVAAFLLSGAASFINGATILVDGGQTIH